MRETHASGRRVATMVLAALVVLVLSAGAVAAGTGGVGGPTAGDVGGGAPPAATSSRCESAEAAWVGTFGYGLGCVDGAGWHDYLEDVTPLPNNLISQIRIGPDERAWIVHSGGVSATNGRTWNTHESQVWGYGSPEAVAFDTDGGVWVAHFQGASHLAAEHWTTYEATQLGSGDTVDLVRGVAVAPDGVVWVVTSNSVASFDGTIWTVYEEGNGLDSNYYFEDIVAGPGGVWAAHSDGLLSWDGSEWLSYSSEDVSQAQTLAIDPEGNVWVGTWARGVSMFDGTGWIVYNRANSDLSSDNIRSLAVDGQGRIWAGTGYGLDVFDGDTWQAYHMHDSGLLDNEVYAVAVSGSGPTLPALVEKAPGSLSGAAVSGSQPVAGTTVELCTETIGFVVSGSSPCYDHPFSQQVTTGQDGGFSFADVPAGRYGLVIQGAAGDWIRLSDSVAVGDRKLLVEAGKETDLGEIDIAQTE